MNYKEILENIVKNGTPKQPVRFDSNNNPIPVENGTIGTFSEIFRHNMIDGFPLTTLRRMPFRSMSIELEGFIKGITNKTWYKARGCGFWNEWGNPEEALRFYNEKYKKPYFDQLEECWIDVERPASFEEVKKYLEMSIDDLGPIYGYQWRNFNKTYETQNEDDGDYSNYTDQLKSIVDKLKVNPYDRRMVCSAWNPNQAHMMALPPCHYAFTVVVYGDKLNLCWKQRSVDCGLGLGSNIAFYGLLQLLLCKESGLMPGELVGILEDCHIYNNHIESIKELIQREERELPTVIIKNKKEFSIFNWTHSDIELIGYDPHPKFNIGTVTV